MTDFSVFDDGAPVASDSAIADLLAKANDLIETERQIAEVEALLKTLSSHANELKTKIIPDKMAEVGLSEFATPDGYKLKIEEFVAGSMPKEPERREQAIKRLEEWGADGVIKNEIHLSFDKSQHNEAMALADDLRQRGFHCEVKSGVHPQTYLAIIRERLASGGEIDLDEMGVFSGRRTKITPPKKGK